MGTTTKTTPKTNGTIGSNFFDQLWEKSWTYIKTVVDVVREPVLILDKHFHVLPANESFYRTFQVNQQDTVGNLIYDLGNGQWNIVALKKLLEDILPKHTFFRGFEVTQKFPSVGKKVMILNARQIHIHDDGSEKEPDLFASIILLAMEDVTEIMNVAEKLSQHTNQFQKKIQDQSENMDSKIKLLEKEIQKLKDRL